MADKINNKEESIARVYQFLSTKKDWQKKADITGDGKVIKTEFRAYLLNTNFRFLTGENKEDLISAFWNSFEGVNGNKVLDGKELDLVERTLEATKQITNFINTKDAPPDIKNSGKVSEWKTSVKQGLIYRASEYLKTSSEGIDEEWLNETYNLSSAKATADYLATSLLESSNRNVTEYKPGSDETFKDIIDEYVAQLEETPKDEATVISEIKNIVSAYIDTANTNSKTSTNLLAQYGYDPDGYLNDLQKASLINTLTDTILKNIADNNPNVDTKKYEKEIKATIKEYLETFLEDKSASEFKSLESLDLSKVVDTDEYKDMIAKIEAAEKAVQDAQNQLNQYIAGLDKNNTEISAAIKTVLNIKATDPTSIMNGITVLKSVEDIKDKHEKLKAKVDEIESKLPDNFFNNIADITITKGNTKIIQLPKSTNKYSTDELAYKVENGGGNISVDSSGKVTVTGNTVGVFRNVTISVMTKDGKVLGSSKPITITIEDKADLSTIDEKYNGHSISDMANNTGLNAIDLTGDWVKDWDNPKGKAKQKLEQVLNDLYELLSNTNKFDNYKLQNAIKTVKSYYSGILDAIDRVDPDSYKYEAVTKSVSYTRYNSDGTTTNVSSESFQYWLNQDKYYSDFGGFDENAFHGDNFCGINFDDAYNNTDDYRFTLNTGILLRKIQEFYNS